MALIDKASLLMVPSTYEDGTLYNVLPSGNKAPDETGNNNGYDQTRADFTFSRGSNLAATRVNSDGLIEKGRENLLTYSNDFSNVAWTPFNASVTSGQNGYDGSNDAYLLNITTSSNSSLYRSISMSGVYTTSVYAKANSVDYLGLRDYSLSGAGNWFNLSNGTIASTTSNCIDAKIESVGNGWYRCSITQNRNATGYTQIGASDNPSTTSGTSGSIFIQDAQLEKGLVATDYIATGSSTAQAGILEDMPRINYDANGENGALLLEPSRSNIVTYSNYLKGSGWSNLGTRGLLTINTSETKSPEGLYNATKVMKNVASGNVELRFTGLTSGTEYTISVYAKKGNFNKLNLDVSDSSSTTVTLTDEWQRFEHTATATNNFLDISLHSSAVQNDYVYLYGVQCEAGSYSSSLIPTHGAAVTRGAENCYANDVSHAIGQTEGTIYAEIDSLQFKTGSYLGISDGTTTNRQIFGWESNSGDSGTLRLYGFWPTSYSTFNKGEKIKVAVAYKANDFALYVNGTQAATNTTASVAGTLSKVGFHSVTPGSQNYQGNAYELALFDTRLTNSELADLTS